jgi:hypothetical protein
MKISYRELFYRCGIIFVITGFILYASHEFAIIRFVDHKIFFSFAKYFQPKSFPSGEGSHKDPYKISQSSSDEVEEQPFIIEIGESGRKIFDADPLSPTDHAVILSSLREHGTTSIFLANTLAWDEPDTLALKALEKQLSLFQPSITSSIVTRSSIDQKLPVSFLRASLDIKNVSGDIQKIPSVNKVVVPHTILGDETSMTGFSIIESEPNTNESSALIARWKDRLIFSSTLLSLIIYEKCSLDKIEIKLGQYIKLGTSGRIIPIDSFGRIINTNCNSTKPQMSVEDLIRPEGKNLRLLQQNKNLIHLISQKDFATYNNLSQLYSIPRMNHTIPFRRLPILWENLLILAIILHTCISSYFRYPTKFLTMLLALCFYICSIVFGHIWLPFYPFMAGFLLPLIFFRKSRNRGKIKSSF